LFTFRIDFTSGTISEVEYYEAFYEEIEVSFFLRVKANYQETTSMFSYGYIFGDAYGKVYDYK